MDVYEQIEDWVSGSMEIADRELFEQQIRKDPELSEKVALYTRLHRQFQADATANAGEQDLRSTLKNAADAYKATAIIPAHAKSPVRKWLYAVSSVAAAGLLLISLKFGLFNTHTDTGKLYSQYDHFDNLSITRGDNDSLETLTVERFNNQDYAKAVPLLRQVIAAKPTETNYIMALGYAFTKQDNFITSDSIFHAVIAGGDPLYKDQAIWQLALGKLKQGKKSEAVVLLKSIPKESDMFKKASELLDKLD